VLTDHNLAAAYGGRLLMLPEGAVIIDDPHHDDHVEAAFRLGSP
jgi:ABC-type hemin transport system ATPase subunit